MRARDPHRVRRLKAAAAWEPSGLLCAPWAAASRSCSRPRRLCSGRPVPPQCQTGREVKLNKNLLCVEFFLKKKKKVITGLWIGANGIQLQDFPRVWNVWKSLKEVAEGMGA